MYVGFGTRTSHYIRTYDKDGKYLRTVIPYPAADVAKKGCKFATTIWGDKVPVPDRGGLYAAGCLGEYLCNPGWFHGNNLEDFKAMKGPAGEKQSLTTVVEFMNKLPGIEAVDITPRPAVLPAARNCSADLTGKAPRLAVDPVREEIYAGGESLFRFNGKTGEFDPSFKDFAGNIFDQAVGPDGLVYIRVCRGALLTRVDREGKPVPFKKENEDAPATRPGGNKWELPKAFRGGPVSALWCGGSSSTEGCFNYCLHISTNGLICTTTNEITPEFAKQHGLRYVAGAANHVDYVNVFDADGKRLTADAVGRVGAGFGSFMDRDGSIYQVYGDVMPAGQNKLDGIVDVPCTRGNWTGFGILVKYRGLGGKYPLNVGPGIKTCSGVEAIEKLRTTGEVAGALWAYPVPGQTDKGCSCGSFREYFDGWSRTWVTSNHLYSIVVLDANGNRMARIGRYGNVDDSEADLKENKDGIRLVWPRAVAASDTALYVSDPGNMRILKAALSYAAEETAPVP
jgi:hypothetical protein